MPVRTSIDPEIVKSVVKTVPMFGCFTDQELSSLLEKTNVYRYSKGEIVFLADERDQQMYILRPAQGGGSHTGRTGAGHGVQAARRLFRGHGSSRR